MLVDPPQLNQQQRTNIDSGNGVPLFLDGHFLSSLQYLCVDIRGIYCKECTCEYITPKYVLRHIKKFHLKSLRDAGIKENQPVPINDYLDQRLKGINNSNDHSPYINFSSAPNVKFYCPDCDIAFKSKSLCDQHYNKKTRNCNKSKVKKIKCRFLHSGHPYPMHKLLLPPSLPPGEVSAYEKNNHASKQSEKKVAVAENNAKPRPKVEHHVEVGKWLLKGLSKEDAARYLESFVEEGFDTMEVVKQVLEERHLNFMKPAHRRMTMKKLSELRS